MKVLIHDLEQHEFSKLFPTLGEELKVISNTSPIHKCIGCFGCWVKTPGQCVIKDEYQKMGEYLSKSDELILITKCYYGEFSLFVKNVIDRCLPFLHPYFCKREGRFHHRLRYNNTLKLAVHYYG